MRLINNDPIVYLVSSITALFLDYDSVSMRVRSPDIITVNNYDTMLNKSHVILCYLGRLTITYYIIKEKVVKSK